MSICKSCSNEKIKEWRKKNHSQWVKYVCEWYRKRRTSGAPPLLSQMRSAIYKRRNRYGVGVHFLDWMLEVQKDRCAICAKKFNGKFHVDHDHDADYVRGLLCRDCNHGLGRFMDNISNLERAIVYLQESFPILEFQRARQARKLQGVES